MRLKSCFFYPFEDDGEKLRMKTALITGGGSGIGRELVRLFAEDDYSVIVFSLLQEELDDLARELSAKYDEERFTLVQADLAQPNAAKEVFDWCAEHHRTVDVVVNNAGFSIAGEHVDQDIDSVHKMLMLNMITLTELSLLFGKEMKGRGHGKILNIGSTTGISLVPLGAAYAASKSFVNSLSISLAIELKPHGVQVSCMQPYLTKTKFVETSIAVSVRDPDAPPPEIEEQEKTGHSVEMVAQYAYEGLKKGKTVILPGLFFVLLSMVIRALPQTLVAKVLYRMVKRQLQIEW
jgi:short-subunit dehydrogenase